MFQGLCTCRMIANPKQTWPRPESELCLDTARASFGNEDQRYFACESIYSLYNPKENQRLEADVKRMEGEMRRKDEKMTRRVAKDARGCEDGGRN